MAKKARAKPVNQAELRRWCIEQAMRWPEVNVYGAAQNLGQLGYAPRSEVDIIGRAKRLLAWITE